MYQQNESLSQNGGGVFTLSQHAKKAYPLWLMHPSGSCVGQKLLVDGKIHVPRMPEPGFFWLCMTLKRSYTMVADF